MFQGAYFNKKLSFRSLFLWCRSGDYEFETQNLRAREYTGKFSTLDTLIEKSINLIRMGIVNLNNATRIDVMSDEFDHNFAFNNARSGILFLGVQRLKKFYMY